jgi:hypothetical protein
MGRLGYAAGAPHAVKPAAATARQTERIERRDILAMIDRNGPAFMKAAC